MKCLAATFLFPKAVLFSLILDFVKSNPDIAEPCFEVEAVDHPEYDGPGYDNACSAVLGPADAIMKLVGFIGAQGEVNLFSMHTCSIERCGNYADTGE